MSRLFRCIPGIVALVIGACICDAKVSQATIQTDAVLATPTSPTEKFDGQYAFSVLKQICDLGPRVSTSEQMGQQQELIRAHFTALGAQVLEQKFMVPHPLNKQPVELKNMVVRFHPERRKRLFFSCHYDTRPFPDQDAKNPQGLFLGANDGASGVGLLFELGKHISQLDGKYGVDIIFFDGEEFVWRAGVDEMFLGSKHFATNYAQGKWDTKYSFGILVDMIGDRDLQIFYEKNSFDFAPKICKSIWGVAAEMGVKEFKQEHRHQIRDDHLPLNTIAKIQTCDIIDFDYPNPEKGNKFWHTEADTPENCSAESLQKVGSVLQEWLTQLQKL